MEIVRNSVSFEESLKRKGLTYADVYYRLNGAGITKFNEILTKGGCLIQNSDTGKYMGRKNFHSSDNGKRTPEETNLDCTVGNIQEALFCLDNVDFKPNSEATDMNVKNDMSITKEPDLIHIPTGAKVEFKTSYSKLYGHDAYYKHRDAGVEKYLNEGNILIINFVNLDKIAVVCKKNLGRSFKIKEPNKYDEKTNKYWDVCTVWDGIMYDYRIMMEGCSNVSKKISDIIKYGNNK